MGRLTRWLLSRLGVVCAVAALVTSSVLAAQTGAGAQAGSEQIVSYDVAIAVQHDASMLVTEQIVYDFGGQDRHGIIRQIPVLRAYNKRYDRYYPVDVRSVTSLDAPAQYTVNYTGDIVTIKIGDFNQTVTGVHIYRLTYLIRSGMDGYADHDELYWDAIGDQWDVPIGHATVRVTTPAAPTRAACWAGPHGSVSQCEQADIADRVATFTQSGLGPHEGLTVAVSIPKGVIAAPHPELQERPSQHQAFALTPVTAGVSGGLLAVLAIAGALVLGRGRRRQTVMEPAPPGDLRPGQAGTLLDGVANPRDVTATIVDLAVRGYLLIEDTGEDEGSQDWRLVRLGQTDGLLDYERLLLDGLFLTAEKDTDVQSVRLYELGTEFASQLERAQDALYADVTDRGWFTTRPDQARRRWRTIGGYLFVGGVLAVIVAATASDFGLVPIPLALAGLVLVAGAGSMPVRTAAGTAMADRVAGFRQYLMTMAAAQAHPAGPPGTLYDYLPYAIAFDCTGQWTGLTDTLARTSQAPSWYQASGSRPPIPAMHHFATVATEQVGYAGGESDSSGSAFGGGSSFSGGFSGGGGGGGGGGSW